ncbi:NADH:flavin oxidoreductase/NADH oxidase [Chelatococcus reniformis]|uniref:Oxidoreductase n=1 Tax=Chelatococcus reniformis TaxID=1494448 RepID=A0A916UM40_9HYPH|nr:NADH:flavin oxidoreductase/NADH oxidase [Chelatococcus reniformis]GGC78100.1 oxidoreductase [Chelatococcus reniformis]
MTDIPLLFQPLQLRSVLAKNRIAVSPMCQYSARDGVGDDWHVQHLGARAAGGAGIVFVEATHVSAVGRITHGCLGLWNCAQQALLGRIAHLITRCGAVPAIQVAHAGRKASCEIPWLGSGPIRREGPPIPVDRGGWQPVAPSALPYDEDGCPPHPLSADEIRQVVDQFATTARLAREAGFKVLEVHAAHGYLLHSFISPLSNKRADAYGGSRAHRWRALMEVLDAVRAEWPAELPLFVRLSCTDYVEGGVMLADSVELARALATRGDVDLIDCSSGGGSPHQRLPPLYPGYQADFARRIRAEAGIATGAVGLIQGPELANALISGGAADLVLVGRAILADPAWPLRAAKALGVEAERARPYQRAIVT